MANSKNNKVAILLPVQPGQFPHPENWDRKWPHPKARKGQPEELFMDMIEFYEINRRKFKKRPFCYVEVKNRFVCPNLHCPHKGDKGKTWFSHRGCVRFDAYTGKIYLYGQKCLGCPEQNFTYPLPYLYQEWRKACDKAIKCK